MRSAGHERFNAPLVNVGVIGVATAGMVSNALLLVIVPAELETMTEYVALSASFTLAMDRVALVAPTYQWRKNGTNIVGAGWLNAATDIEVAEPALAVLFVGCVVIVGNVVGRQLPSPKYAWPNIASSV